MSADNDSVLNVNVIVSGQLQVPLQRGVTELLDEVGMKEVVIKESLRLSVMEHLGWFDGVQITWDAEAPQTAVAEVDMMKLSSCIAKLQTEYNYLLQRTEQLLEVVTESVGSSSSSNTKKEAENGSPGGTETKVSLPASVSLEEVKSQVEEMLRHTATALSVPPAESSERGEAVGDKKAAAAAWIQEDGDEAAMMHPYEEGEEADEGATQGLLAAGDDEDENSDEGRRYRLMGYTRL